MATHNYQCDECHWTGELDDVAAIDDVEERVAPGELHPAGQCPECGALISVNDEDVPDYTLQACAEIMRTRGWQVKEN